MTASDDIQSFSVDDIFGDATLHAANQAYDQYILKPNKKSMADYLRETIVDDEMDMINYRTGQNNDPFYIAALLEWYLTGTRLGEMCDGETEIPIDIIKSYVHLDHLIHGEEDDDLNSIFSLYTEEMYVESFVDIMQHFIGINE